MSTSRLQPPSVLESSLYCPDLDGAERFYRDVLGLEVVARQVGATCSCAAARVWFSSSTRMRRQTQPLRPAGRRWCRTGPRVRAISRSGCRSGTSSGGRRT
jgi:catechol 2,3-dioxygenase-like lactoylglutathione lyase family enzyme